MSSSCASTAAEWIQAQPPPFCCCSTCQSKNEFCLIISISLITSWIYGLWLLLSSSRDPTGLCFWRHSCGSLVAAPVLHSFCLAKGWYSGAPPSPRPEPLPSTVLVCYQTWLYWVTYRRRWMLWLEWPCFLLCVLAHGVCWHISTSAWSSFTLGCLPAMCPSVESDYW